MDATTNQTEIHAQIVKLAKDTGINDGTGTLYAVCEQAIRDGEGTPERVREIWAEATKDAREITIQRIDAIPTDGITARDLRGMARDGGEAYRVTLAGHAECMDVLWMPNAGRAGVAWGADAIWTDASSVEDAVRRVLSGDVVA